MTKLYDKYPSIPVSGWEQEVWVGYQEIADALVARQSDREKTVIVIECYPGVRQKEILSGLSRLGSAAIVHAERAAKDKEDVSNMIDRYLTDDRVFGYMAPFHIQDFYNSEKLEVLQDEVKQSNESIVIVIGTGASLIADGDIVIYADMTRWEAQLRFRSKEFGNWLADNQEEDILRKYKRGYFIEWRAADRLKRKQADRFHFYLDTIIPNEPKLISSRAYFDGLRQTVRRPFRMVPYFDPGVWGGQWLESQIELEPKEHPYAWGFDGVPEENSLHLDFGKAKIDTPAINLVFFESKALLGERVYARFGAEFPIRFDFLDTIGGQNLSLQVHPTTDYIREQFGMPYTQDESYYILDAKPGAEVYLGLKEGIDQDAMIADLRRAQEEKYTFPAEKYINVYPARKHDHFLIPAGTIHCSGSDAMVLEISATPYIFTFKLWDWDRLGLDGKPRPVHLEHGKNNIAWERTTPWIDENLVSQMDTLTENETWTEERTGLHPLEFIETRRHWFTGPVEHTTEDCFHMLNLVEGAEAIVESPTGEFEPFTIRYAETFIIPASVGRYTIKPGLSSEGERHATVKAYVRN
ncbi:class I mannose-6-phosphate isomerase [Paenibacillus wynnii]|uniref:Mannose-6-phosphate isomerase n=1 Tax=Paenibacillus wynnii TaxID=268407 RepID=A0A098M844_9BACL|nr:class I mannose-6-phosphate isomerase [Paenibacillus wynnii]KGE18744.1 mannose-6-phosphate isomerase [Paenibacillus wynnii]